MSSFRRYRDIIIVVLLLAVPFFFLRASIRRPEEMSVVDRTIMRVAAPLEYVSAALARGISSLFGDYVYLVDVKKDNDKLAYENARLRAEVRELKSAEAENVRMRRLLNLRETISAETVSAVVIGKDTTEFFRVAHVTLDNPGVQVKPGMPVLSFDGTVGTVLRVAGDKVDVELTVDAGFGVDVVVERTGARGFVRGVGDRSRYGVRVEYVQRSDEVDVGDVLLTSGVGCRFPKGVPVARVNKVIKRDFGMYQTVEAEPTVDFSRLEEVLVVLSDSKDCEAKGGGAQRRPRAKL
ncbi:MAG: rod shape-determining protein MreC [Polyangiaceae bacterium]|nr:rod shape-determining protein MreC [Polyangiaceae bacterium]MCE7892087.1 rod shape-determining protein MreC [Sorangiineae bacterium PRO1]